MMKAETIVVLVLTAIALAGVVWLELKSRATASSPAVAPPPDSIPPVIDADAPTRKTKRR